MTNDPVATAASNNPALSTLVEAVTAANLGDALNSAKDVTVLAPANPAFEAVPADALESLLADKAQLTAVLTHHVIEGRLAPDQLAGEHTTLNGDTVTIEGSGEDSPSPPTRRSWARPTPPSSAATCRPPTRRSTSSTRC